MARSSRVLWVRRSKYGTYAFHEENPKKEREAGGGSFCYTPESIESFCADDFERLFPLFKSVRLKKNGSAKPVRVTMTVSG